MANLNPLELGRLKSLLSGGTLTIEEKLSTLDILRSRFPSFFSSLKPGLTEENLKDNNFLIKYLTNPYNRNKIKNALRNELSLSTAQRTDLEQALSERPVATEGAGGQPASQGTTPATAQEIQPAGAITGTSAGGMPFGMPAATTSYSAPAPRRFIHNVPQVEKPDIAIANKSGVVIEKASPGSPPKIYLADRTGRVIGEQSGGIITKTPPPKIALANSSGVVTKEYTIAPKRFNLSSFRSSFKSTFKKVQNFASPAGPFLKVNLGRVANGFREMLGGVGGGLGGLGRTAVGPGLSGVANLGGRAGLGAINHGGNFLSNLSNTRSRFSTASKSFSPKNLGSKRAAWIFGGVFLLILLMGLVGGLTGTTTPGEAAPITPPGSSFAGTSNISSCKFTRAGNPQTIKSTILQNWIVNAANAAGIPAQVLASISMHESQDFTANADDNHDAIKTNQYCNKGKAFCEDGHGHVLHSKADEDKDDPCTPEEIANGNRTAQAVGLMQNLDIYNPGKDLCSITENLNIAAIKLKADGVTQQPSENLVKDAIKNYYGGKCTYGRFSYCDEVWQDLQNCQPQSTATTPVQPILPGLAGITNAAIQIIPLLYQTNPASASLEDRLFHNKRDEPGIYYWCTYLIIDSYNATGLPGLNRASYGGVLNMKSFFANTSGYQLLPSNASVEQLQPGDVIFFEGKGQHTSLIKSVDVNSEGNGVIRTLESNNVVIEDVVYVQNHQATVAQTTAKTYAITGFGQIKS